MRSVFRVVASMVVVNAAVAYGADAKSAVQTLKQGATATAADAKTKASELAKGTETKAKEVKATTTEAVKDATKKADASQATSPATQPATAPISAETVKEAVAAQGDTSGLAGERKSLIIPESAVLPESVLRFRAIYGSASSTKGYDADANKVENGVKVTANRSVAVLEYGITERISAQFLVPYFLSGKVTVDDNAKFQAAVKAQVDAGVAAALTKIKAGLTAGGAGALYTNNIEAQADITLDPATGLKIPKGAKVKDYVDVTLARAFTDQGYATAKATAESVKFQEGLGDIEIGAKYALSTVKEPWFDGVPFYTSVAAGVRLNSSKYADAVKDGKKTAGRGTTDLGIRLNADYEPVNGVQLQLENQTELMLAKGKTYAAATKSEVDYARDGMRQIGYSKLVVAPGTWVEPLNFVMLNARYNWDNEAATKTDGKLNVGSASVGRSAQFGVGFDGLKLKLPVQLDYDYLVAARSRNVPNAFDAHVATLKLFYKF